MKQNYTSYLLLQAWTAGGTPAVFFLHLTGLIKSMSPSVLLLAPCLTLLLLVDLFCLHLLSCLHTFFFPCLLGHFPHFSMFFYVFICNISVSPDVTSRWISVNVEILSGERRRTRERCVFFTDNKVWAVSHSSQSMPRHSWMNSTWHQE